MKKKILILSISTGQGHHEIGKAVAEGFESMGHETKFLDAYKYASKAVSKIISAGYLTSITYVPNFIARKVYNVSQKKTTPFKKLAPMKVMNDLLALRLKKAILEYNPDIIVCTHVLSAMLAERIVIKEWSNAVTCGIVTDFTVHPFWENTYQLDFIVTPSELLNLQLEKKGIDISKVLPYGIPVDKKFTQKKVREDIIKKYKLSDNKKTLLIMAGSMGYGNIIQTTSKLDALDFDFQIIVVCGNNAVAYEQLNALSYKKKIKIFGYSNDIESLMEVADIIITKPGGRTISESLIKGLPIIINDPIAGHEERNAEFLQNNGLALYVNNTFTVEEAVYSLLSFPTRLTIRKQAIKLFAKPNATKDLCNALIKKSNE